MTDMDTYMVKAPEKVWLAVSLLVDHEGSEPVTGGKISDGVASIPVCNRRC